MCQFVGNPRREGGHCEIHGHVDAHRLLLARVWFSSREHRDEIKSFVVGARDQLAEMQRQLRLNGADEAATQVAEFCWLAEHYPREQQRHLRLA